jgi:hypothetical protein
MLFVMPTRSGAERAGEGKDTMPKSQKKTVAITKRRRGDLAAFATHCSVGALSAMAGSVGAAGSGAALGMAVLGPPGAAAGFLVGFAGGMVAGGAAGNYAASRLLGADEEEGNDS